MPMMFRHTIPTMTYDPATIEAVFRVIHKYKQYLKPFDMTKMFLMVEADGDIQLQYAMKTTRETLGLCRYHDGLTGCTETTIPYTQQGLLVTNSTVVFKIWHWVVPGKKKPIRLQRLELFIAIDGKPVEYLPNHFSWL
jgi:hypothetical protein